jgi:uncharacterized protein involved in outer membrane biogenesis
MLQANLRSKVLDLDDLAPLIGASPKTGPGETASAEQQQKAAAKAKDGKVVPREPLKSNEWAMMDADVRLAAARVRRAETVPIDALAVHVVLKDALLRLDPLTFEVAGGHVGGTVALNGQQRPVRGELDFDVRGLHLGRLFPQLESTKQQFGTLHGKAQLTATGTSLSDLIGTSDGRIRLAVNGGQVSLFLVELLGIDLAEAVRLLGTRNRQVTLRCAVADFEVKDGTATPRAFVVDTTDTVVGVTGSVDLKDEKLALVFRPEPKDISLFALRSPIHLEGTFSDPSVRPEAGPIVVRVAAAALLATVNPVLAIIPFFETGPGKDSDCGKLLAQANVAGAKPGAAGGAAPAAASTRAETKR